jgi:hypothetical protein
VGFFSPFSLLQILVLKAQEHRETTSPDSKVSRPFFTATFLPLKLQIFAKKKIY